MDEHTWCSIISWAAVSLLLLALAHVASARRSLARNVRFLPQNWIGVRREWASMYRAEVRTLHKTRELLTEGYERFSTKGLPFVLPQLHMPPVVLLPAEDVADAVRLPEHIIDHFSPNLEAPGVKYTLGTKFLVGPHVDFIKQELTRGLGRHASLIDAEVQLAIEQKWSSGDETDWQVFKVYPSCLKIVAQVLNRVFCGTELCRDPQFLYHLQRHSESIFNAATIIQLLPQFCRPWLALLLKYRTRRHFQACKKSMVPVIRQRLSCLAEASETAEDQVPDDALQILVRMVANDTTVLGSEPMDEDMIVHYILVLNLLALFTTSMAATNTLMNLYGSPASETYVGGIRDECARHLPELGENGYHNTLDKLVRLDSSIRESLRVTPLVDIGARRLAVEGFKLRNGTQIPPGAYIAAPVYHIHTDPQFYPHDPKVFDAFRFSRPAEARAKAQDSATTPCQLQRSEESPEHGTFAPVTGTRSSFLSFGHGRHACPGRFFASHVLKLTLARLVMRYDMEIRGTCEHTNQISAGNRPSDKVELWVTRRRGS